MEVLVFLLAATGWLNICSCKENTTTNSTDLGKDMYVIHAMVYQVGIVTNATSDESSNGTIGNQEVLALYHNNGSNIDLKGLPTPLMTNVTAQSLVGIAPKTDEPGIIPDRLTNMQQTAPTVKLGDGVDPEMLTSNSSAESNAYQKTRRSCKRDASEDHAAVKIVKGTAKIPEAADITSLVIPPLLILNNNMSEIPVPIPNISVVHYAIINTLVTNTNKSEHL